MNIIIAGDGEVGFHLAKSLSELDHDITVVDPHQDLLRMLETEIDILTITGYSTSIDVLTEANIENCDLLISVLHDESINLLTCVLGKKFGAKRTIARINNIEYLKPENKKIFKDLGVDEVVSPERIAAKEIINLLEKNSATEIFNFSKDLLSIYLIRIDENAKVIGKTMRDIFLENTQIEARIVAILRHSKTIIPNLTTTFQKNDLAYVISKPEDMGIINILGGKKDFHINSVIIAGGGRIGTKTAQTLEEKMSVKLIDMDKERCYGLTNTLNNTLIINGDATDIDLLEDEGIDKTDAFIAVTNSTETNILTCLHAKKHGVKKTIALVENIDFIDLSQDIGIDTIINKKLITASYIARFTVKGEASSSKWLSGTNAEVIEFVVHEKAKATKKPIYALDIPEGATIGGIIRGDEAIIPKRNFQIEANDKVVVFTLPKVLSKIAKLFN